MYNAHRSEISNYYAAQKALLQDKIDDLTLAETYALDDLEDGYITI